MLRSGRVKASLIVLPVVAGLALLNVGRTPEAQGNSSSYRFSNVSVEPSEIAPDSQTRVHFTYEWATGTYPGTRECTFKVFDAGNNEVGQKTMRFTGLGQAPETAYTDVETSGIATSADVDCDEGSRFDQGTYRITRPRVGEILSDRVGMTFLVSWDGTAEPGGAVCHGEILSREGAVLVEGDFSLKAGKSEEHELSHYFPLPEPLREKPSGASLSCEGL